MASVGPTLKVEGFAQYKKNMNELIQQGKTLDSEMKRVASTWDDNTTAQQKAADKAKVLTERIENQKRQVEALRDMAAKASAQYGENSREAQIYKEKLNLAEAALNDLNKELDENQAELKQSAEKTDELGDETQETGKKSEAAGKLIKGLGSTAKVAAATATAAFAATVAAATKVVSALTDMTVAGSNYADEILTEATATGLSTDALQKYHYAAGLIDVDVNVLTRSLSKNTAQMAKAKDGSGAAAEAYGKLGVSVKNNRGELRDSEEVFWEAVDALGKIENETERDALAMELFGKSAQELNPLIEQGSKRMKELGEEAEKAGAVLGNDTLNAYGEFNDKLEQLKSGSEAAKRALGTALLPILDKLAGEGVDMLGDFSRALLDCNGDIEKMASVASEYLGKAVEVISEYLPEMAEMGAELLGGLLEGVIENTPAILDAVGDALDSVLDVLAEKAPEIEEAVLTFAGNLAGSVVEAVYKIGYNAGRSLGELIRQAIAEAFASGPEEFPEDDGESRTYYNAAYYNAGGNLVTGKTRGVHKRGEGIGNSGPVNSRDADAQANKEYREGLFEAEAIKACVEAANEAIAELEQSYNDAYSAALTSIQGQYHLWDTLDDKADAATMSISDLNAAMDSQIEYWTKYADNLNNLLDRNIDGLSDMVAAMDDGSAQSKAAISALADASDVEIKEMVAKWEELQEAQGRAAEANRDATFDMEDAVGQMAEKTEAKLDELGQSMDLSDDARSAAKKTIDAFSDGLNDSVAGAVANAKTIGDQLANGVSSGIEGAAWKIAKAGQSAVTGALASMKAVAQIASPSKITTGYGRYLVEGLVKGLESGTPNVVKSAGKLMADTLDTIGNGSLPAERNNVTTTTNTYNNSRNLGGVTIEINTAPGQSAEEIADAVMDRINDAMTSERDAF